MVTIGYHLNIDNGQYYSKNNYNMQHHGSKTLSHKVIYSYGFTGHYLIVVKINNYFSVCDNLDLFRAGNWTMKSILLLNIDCTPLFLVTLLSKYPVIRACQFSVRHHWFGPSHLHS